MRNFHFSAALLPGGWAEDVVIACEDGVIADMSVGAPCPPFTDRLAGVAVPGVANLHSHAHHRALAGLAERSGSGDEMERLVQAISPDDLETIATHAYVEMLQGGYTHVAEFHGLHHQPDGTPYADRGEMAHRVRAAAQAAGIGMTLLPALHLAGGPGVAAGPGRARSVIDLDGFAALLPGTDGLAVHSPHTVPAEALAGLLALAPTGPVHVQVAERAAEVEACLAATGQRPVAWLLDHAAVNARWCLVHATHVDAAEIAAMARHGAVTGLCPTTAADLGHGMFPAAAFQAACGRFGVGSGSQLAASWLDELRLLEWGQRLITGRRAVLAGGPGRSTGRTLLQAAATAGAAACGIAAGSIEVGQRADVVVLAGTGGTDAAVDRAVFAPRGNPVRHVVARGECVVRDGRHRLGEIAAARFGRVMARLEAAI